MRLLAGFLAISFLASCSTLPRPGADPGPAVAGEAQAVLQRSARAHGDPWWSYRHVEVAYAGEWSAIATRLQPVLTDPEFRKDSVELKGSGRAFQQTAEKDSCAFPAPPSCLSPLLL